MRTRVEMRTATTQYQEMNNEVETLRNGNAALETEVRRLRTDKHAIEAAARTRLNMVRANEMVVPIE
jgi:cell division protein FtsB